MESLSLSDGELYLDRAFLSGEEADRLFTRLLDEIAWQEEAIKVYGRSVKVPRLVAWYGDPGAHYTYSGVTHAPLAWTPALARLKARIETATAHRFNSVLANLYRNERDSMGWHADKERELGSNPVIASLSLGQRRLFKLRHNKTKETVDLWLEHGTLLLMAGALQHHWRHCLPKSRQPMGPRINLTFRTIVK